MPKLKIGVIGGGTATARQCDAAREVGRLIAARGAILVCGGLGGVMEAACKGASDSGGTTIGILPGSSSGDANPYVQIAVPTGMGHARNVIVAMTSDCLVAVGGSYGTVSEIVLARKLGRPVAVLEPFEFVPRGEWSSGIIWGREPSTLLAELVSAVGKVG
jgi:uncharacterized protein (TIGR00725 family)